MPQSYTNDKAKSERKKKSERWENGNWREKKIVGGKFLKKENYHKF
jgi:hypothetical protein